MQPLTQRSSNIQSNAACTMHRGWLHGNPSLRCAAIFDDKRIKVLKDICGLGPWLPVSRPSHPGFLHLQYQDAMLLRASVDDSKAYLSKKGKLLFKQVVNDFPEQHNPFIEVKKIDRVVGVTSTSKKNDMSSSEISILKETSNLVDRSDQVVSSKSQSLSDTVVIVFDIETTGFKVSVDRIVEFAARDLAGGDRSTFTTLVNPEMEIPCFVSNIHGITTNMVNIEGIPRWKEVAPVLVQFVEMRRQSRPVILVAHNGKKFDVPFLIKEFERCSMEIPSSWQFLDTLPLAREAMKSKGLTTYSLSLSSLHEHYKLPFAGEAHRAKADVDMLASVLRKLTMDLKMPVSAFLQRAFTAEDLSKQEQ